MSRVTNQKPKHAGGRPPKLGKLKPQDLLFKLAAYGHIDKEIADILGVSEPTLNAYKKDHELKDALKRGKVGPNKQVRMALYRRCLGYDVIEKTSEIEYPKAHPEGIMVVTKEVTKHIPPDVGGCFIWLQNRCTLEEDGEEWNNKHSVNLAEVSYDHIKKQKEAYCSKTK